MDTKRSNRTKALIAILIMVISMAAILAWIILGYAKQRKIENDNARNIARIVEEGVSVIKEATDISTDIIYAEHVYSHRGVEGSYEHSFKAYDEAIEAGSRYIEQDVVLSSDGVLFVSHDLNALSMTGVNASYSAMSADEIDQLKTRAGYKVLRLSEVFDRYGKDINYVIELKSSGQSTIEAFEEIVSSYGYQDIVTAQSVYTEVLKELDDSFPDMPKLFVCKTQQQLLNSMEMDYVDIISVKYNAGLMTENNCNAVHEKGKKFSAWTLSSEYAIRSAIEMGLDSYFTDDTEMAMTLERKYRDKTSFKK